VYGMLTERSQSTVGTCDLQEATLLDNLKGFEIFFAPRSLLFNHAAKSLGNEGPPPL
jgi:hypothetical protein